MSEKHPKKKSLLHITSHPAHAEEGGEGNWLVSYADMMTLLVGFFVILNSFSKIDDEKFEKAKKDITLQFGGTYQLPYKDIVDRLKDALSKMGIGDQVVIKENEKGVDISFMGTVFFNTGSADIKGEGTALLEKMMPIIKGESKDFDITIEGHTDNVPISGGSVYHNNWELSSLRACRVLLAFEDAGFPKDRLTAVGYADSHPIVPNLDKDGNPIPANQSQNRRVVIRLIKHGEPTLGS